MIKHLVFDLDDTLTRTSDYFRQELIDYFVRREEWKNLEVLARHATDNMFKLPQSFRDIIRERIVEPETYILNVRPSLLFNYYFLIPGNIHSDTKVSICTMRGVTPNAMEKSQQWLDLYRPVVNIHDIHVLNPEQTPSKLDYLRNVYGDEFLLIDDNPFFDVTKIHERDTDTVVYEGCVQYGCNRHQNKLVFEDSRFKVNGIVVY